EPYCPEKCLTFIPTMGTLLIRFIVSWFMTNKMRYIYKGGEFYAARTWKQHMRRAKWQNSPIRQRESIAKVFSMLIDVAARITKLSSISFCLHSAALCIDFLTTYTSLQSKGA